jgi:hypothetical protein
MTLDAILEWDAVAGATTYQVKATDGVNNPIITSDPLDSDAQGVAGAAGALSYPVSKFLTGKPLGTYKFAVRPGGGNPWSAFISFDYTGLAAPTNLRFS